MATKQQAFKDRLQNLVKEGSQRVKKAFKENPQQFNYLAQNPFLELLTRQSPTRRGLRPEDVLMFHGGVGNIAGGSASFPSPAQQMPPLPSARPSGIAGYMPKPGGGFQVVPAGPSSSVAQPGAGWAQGAAQTARGGTSAILAQIDDALNASNFELVKILLMKLPPEMSGYVKAIQGSLSAIVPM